MSKTSSTVLATILVLLLLTGIGFVVYFRATPSGRETWNRWFYSLEKVDEQTYTNQRMVENTTRAMIASYNVDKLIYEQYKNSEISEERSWANNAKIRANQTASTYNNYILQNNYVWKDNVPADIYMNLAYLE